MKMKSIIVMLLACMASIATNGQECVKDAVVIANTDSCSTESIQSAIDACRLLAEAAESKNTTAFRKAKKAMEKCSLSNFGALRSQNRDAEKSLVGHLVFNVAFADSLANGKDAYKNSDNINRSSVHRGQMQQGGILTKTCLIKAKNKSVYTFVSSDRQELAVVAEPRGLITTRVHAVNKTKGINEWHNDTTDVTKGRSSRKTAFNLPSSPRTQVTLEITNCTSKDISVVVISN